jgi:hypothetical protein
MLTCDLECLVCGALGAHFWTEGGHMDRDVRLIELWGDLSGSGTYNKHPARHAYRSDRRMALPLDVLSEEVVHPG